MNYDPTLSYFANLRLYGPDPRGLKRLIRIEPKRKTLVEETFYRRINAL